MGRPKAGYFAADKKRVPGVTTVLSMMKGDPGALMYWAWDLGMQGKDFREERDKAAGTVTIAHDLIEADILGQPAPTSWDAEAMGVPPAELADMVTRAQAAFGAYQTWRASTRLEIIASEVSLVSEEHRFGGTLDAIGTVNGELALIDWKSSNRIYPEYIAQVSAYGKLWEECRGEEPRSVHLLRVGKEAGDFHHHCWQHETLQEGWRAFVLCRELYDLSKKLKKVT
jgi:hypothetical protein